MGNKKAPDFARDLTRTLDIAENAPEPFDHTSRAPKSVSSFEEAMAALVDEALRMGYTHEEVTSILSDTIRAIETGDVTSGVPDQR